MFNGEYFIYDGTRSDKYGLRIATFSPENTEQTAVLTPTLNSVKAARSNRFVSSGVSYTEPPQYDFSMVADEPLHPYVRREILRWLMPNDTFKVLEVEQPDLVDIKYHCRFSNINITYQNGWCVGFTGTILFDSWYAYGTPVTYTTPATLKAGLSESGEIYAIPQNIEDQREENGTGDYSDYVQFTLVNDSDMREAYTYPIVTFKVYQAFHIEGKYKQVQKTDEDGDLLYNDDGTPVMEDTEELEDYDLIIENVTDNIRCGVTSENTMDEVLAARPFEFIGLDKTYFNNNVPTDEEKYSVTVDNELKLISSDNYDTYLEKFEGKNWLRVCPYEDFRDDTSSVFMSIEDWVENGANTFRVWINGSVTIECPRYVLIGF